MEHPDGPLAAENDITNCLQRPTRLRFRLSVAPPVTYHPAFSHLSRSRQAHVPRGVPRCMARAELSKFALIISLSGPQLLTTRLEIRVAWSKPPPAPQVRQLSGRTCSANGLPDLSQNCRSASGTPRGCPSLTTLISDSYLPSAQPTATTSPVDTVSKNPILDVVVELRGEGGLCWFDNP